MKVASLAVLISLLSLSAGAETPAKTLYLLQCSGCHGTDGSGDPRVDVPPFPGFIGSFLLDPSGRSYITNVGGVMSAGLNDYDTARVLNWVLKHSPVHLCRLATLRDSTPRSAQAAR